MTDVTTWNDEDIESEIERIDTAEDRRPVSSAERHLRSRLLDEQYQRRLSDPKERAKLDALSTTNVLTDLMRGATA